MSREEQRVGYGAVRNRVSRIFAAYLDGEAADYVANCLVAADARGVASHGVGRIPVYTERLRLGLVNRDPRMAISGEGAMGHLHGDNGMGYLVARAGMAEAVKRAGTYGIGMVLASHSNHFGMAATYLQEAVEAGFCAFVFTNAPPLMPVWGGRSPFLGTSPFGFAAPGATPFLLDMATSTVAFGKIRRAARLGESIPGEWALDAEGRPTTDPKAAIDGVVLPMAGPKGSGLGLMMEIVAGVMSGSAFGGEVRNQNSDFTAPQNVGHAFIAFHPNAGLPPESYASRFDHLVDRAKASSLADGVDRIIMPGEREQLSAQAARRDGLQLTQNDLDMLDDEEKRAAQASGGVAA